MYNPQLSTGRYTAPIEEPGAGPFSETAMGEYVPPLSELLRIIWRRLWVIGLVTVALVGMAVGFSLMQTPVYESSIKILVGQERGITQNPAEAGGLRELTKTMAEGVNSRPVAQGVIRQLNLGVTPEDFLKQVSIEQIPETQFVQVKYRDSSPERAQQVANTIGDVFSEQVSEVSSSASSITATVWERAQTPAEPASPKPVRNGLLALVLGLMLGIGLALLLEYLDDSWRSPEEAEQISGVPTFGVIPQFGAPTGKKKGQNLG